ncbi:hypothetical protein GmHk_12G035433 [Glycine max]|nr:hypothetical protein GmHk_12G035433 [Glycine max]
MGMTPTEMTFSTAFAYLDGERINNVVWTLEQFQDKDSTLMNLVKIVFLEETNFLCRFHIDKNVKAKCKTLLGNKVMHLGSITTNRVEFAHWPLKRLLQNSLEDLCSVWKVMNNMITLQHTEIEASFGTSTHVVEHIFKVTLYKRLIGMVSKYTLNQIVVKYVRVNHVGINSSRYACIMRITHGLPCVYELARYVLGSIPLDTIHMFWWRLSFSDQGLSEFEVCIIEEMELDVCGKVTLKSKLREIVYPNLNSMCAPPKKVNEKGAQKKHMTKQQRSTKCDLSY